MTMPAAEAPSVKAERPFIVSRDGGLVAYRLLGIRRRGLAPNDPGYWFIQFEPKSGLGIVVDRTDRLTLQRGLASMALHGSGVHFVRVIRTDGHVYWEGKCPLTERELELRFAEIDRHGEHEVDLIPPASERHADPANDYVWIWAPLVGILLWGILAAGVWRIFS